MNGFQKVSELIADNPRFIRYPGELGSDFNHPEKVGYSLNGSYQTILEMGDSHGFEKDEDGWKQFARDDVEENVNPIPGSISANHKSALSPDLKKYKFASVNKYFDKIKKCVLFFTTINSFGLKDYNLLHVLVFKIQGYPKRMGLQTVWTL